MKSSLSSFDVTAMVGDMQSLVGGFLDKVYHPSPDRLVLGVRVPDTGKMFVHFVAGQWLYISKASGEMPQEPSAFARMLRKNLSNSKIVSVTQQGFDRIAVLGFEKGGRYDLILELFGKGNAVLVKEGLIVQPLTSRTWKHRDVRARKPFSFPPPIPDPMVMPTEELATIMKESDSDVVRTIATKLNIGGKYSEEVCARAGLDKDKPAKDLAQEDISRLVETVRGLIREVRTSRRGIVVKKGDELVDVVPAELVIYQDLESEEAPSFSDAVESYVGLLPEPPAEAKKRKPGDDELDRLKRTLAQQEAAALSLQRESLEAQRTGDSLFAKYSEVAHVLMTAKDLLSQAKELNGMPGFVSFDKRRGLLIMNMPSGTYELDVNGTVESNAQRYYENGKKMKAKLEGLLPALESTRGAIAAYNRQQAEERAAERPAVKPSKRFWFERYRWFVSSEGAIVLGGKDARTNDMLVKKHLEPGDRYAHADMHGAPSVVVKMREGVGEQTLMEACQFAVATSKAWNAKIGSSVGYWVLPEQVSKTPQSGEYLARGAFVIRGKRNYSPKAEIRLAVGEVRIEGERKVMCGPESAVKVLSSRLVIIRPGEFDKNLFAKLLAQELEVPIEEVQSVLPPGNVAVVDQVGLNLGVTS
ncbi:TPA: fibronectin-binding domain-containing protein [Thermoplasmata archaeon]|nr:fibronectin-binding domain-containing protein [Thermoplasmata archaeon]